MATHLVKNVSKTVYGTKQSNVCAEIENIGWNFAATGHWKSPILADKMFCKYQ